MPPKPVVPAEEAFLSRWSRRKQSAPDGPVVEEVAVEGAVGEDTLDETPTDESLTDEELLAELDLPDPDTMEADGDFSAFMRARVPERLRRRALRRLWRSNPVLANLDELVDYGEDYTDAATVMENMQTVYEVGKGAAEKWKRHVAALAAAAEDEAPEEIARETPSATVAEGEAEAIRDVPPLETRPDDPAETRVSAIEPDEFAPPPTRHMRFRFD